MSSKLRLLAVCTVVGVVAESASASPGDPQPIDARTPPADPQPQAAGDPRPITNEATPMAASDPGPSSAPPRTYEQWSSAHAASEKPARFSYAWNDPTLQSGIGVGVSAGGGISGFTDPKMREMMTNSVAGLGSIRVALGTQIPLGVELGYTGMAGHINTITGQSNGTLVGTTFEGVLRYNVLPHNLVSPYVFAGLGWQHYGVWNMQVAQADTGLRSSDDVMSVPTGVGFLMHDPSGVSLDVRGEYRTTTDSTLLRDQTGGYADLASWEASAQLGYEF